ncbi:DUF2381 family protein [Myxococcus stipitatus]|uniref:DUF2381 family protein n=1 Tax=Myxococcus stipitatus TaxID=83455 RepID=UPI00314549A0
MHRSMLAVLLVLLRWGEGEAWAQSPSSPAGWGIRRIELSPDAVQPAAEVVVSPGLSTVFIFDSEVSRESVALEGRERFSVLDTGLSTLRFVPSERISSGERLRLTVRFQDGAAPASATFILVAHPARSEALVEVYRRKRGAETYQEEIRQVRIEAQQCRDEIVRLRAERTAPDGLTGLISTGVLEWRGVEFLDVTRLVTQSPGGAVTKRRVYSYRAARRVAVALILAPVGDAQPWTAEGATLRGKANEELRVLQVWQAGPVAPGSLTQRVVVEAESATESPEGSYTLKLWDADGRRTITLDNIVFP